VEALCGASFDAFKDVPQHVCCEAKACLDDVAFALQRQSDARLVIVGNATTLEKAATNQGYVSDLDARRAIVTKEYIVSDKGIDPSRIEIRVGKLGEKTVQTYLVPPRADFDADVLRTTQINEQLIKATRPLPQR